MNLLKNRSNVRIILYLYEINKLIVSTDLNFVKKSYWFYFTVIVFLWIINMIGKLIFDVYWTWIRVVFCSLSIIFDLDMGHTISVVYMLTIKTDMWSNIVKNTNFDNPCDDECENSFRRMKLKRMQKVMKLISELWWTICDMSELKVIILF